MKSTTKCSARTLASGLLQICASFAGIILFIAVILQGTNALLDAGDQFGIATAWPSTNLFAAAWPSADVFTRVGLALLGGTYVVGLAIAAAAGLWIIRQWWRAIRVYRDDKAPLKKQAIYAGIGFFLGMTIWSVFATQDLYAALPKRASWGQVLALAESQGLDMLAAVVWNWLLGASMLLAVGIAILVAILRCACEVGQSKPRAAASGI